MEIVMSKIFLFFGGGGGIFSGKKCRVLFKSKFSGYYLIFKFNLNFDSSFQTKVVTFYIIITDLMALMV